jgi:hypothetical protein
MAVACAVLSPSALTAQTRGLSFAAGLTATLGGEWQLQGVDAGYVKPVNLGLFRFVNGMARIGTFVNEATVTSGARGFVGGLAVGAETPLVTIFDVGAEQSPTRVAFNVTLEVSGYLASKSPFPQGHRFMAVALLPAVRSVQTENVGFSLMVGPVALLGHQTDVRALLSVRLEIPFARAPAGP